jgi:hypothetical protein
LLKETQKPPEFRQICQTKINLCKIGQIRQKSARNWEPARNKKFPPDNFQIRQNCPNLAEKTAIWQRCLTKREKRRRRQKNSEREEAAWPSSRSVQLACPPDRLPDSFLLLLLELAERREEKASLPVRPTATTSHIAGLSGRFGSHSFSLSFSFFHSR